MNDFIVMLYGDTYQYKQIIKDYGFKYDGESKIWWYHGEGGKTEFEELKTQLENDIDATFYKTDYRRYPSMTKDLIASIYAEED